MSKTVETLTSALHVGAVVYLDTANGLYPTTIGRLTETQGITDCMRRFYLDPPMRQVGSKKWRAYLPTEAVLARYKREAEERKADRERRMGFTPETP